MVVGTVLGRDVCRAAAASGLVSRCMLGEADLT